MKRKGTELGNLSARFFAYTQLKNKTVIRTGEIAPVLNITEAQEYDLLRRLTDSGWIVRLKRGVYLIPARLPAGGKYSPGTSTILDRLMKEYEGEYQITGPNAFNFYGFDDQVPNRYYVYNNRISGKRTIGNQMFQFIKTSDQRLGYITEIATPQGVNLIYSSKARTLVDVVYDWSRFNSLPRGYKWIESEIETELEFASELVDATIKYGNQAAFRRIGYLLDLQGQLANIVAPLLNKLSKSKSLIPWIPNKASRGSLNRKWGLIVNG
ncbi:MAG: type IV toxin-antitoxin system AbiEi family antitoxin domain-containing protein [Candidatus Marinimicrobia bacterium]|nr:type IV toxin-antitoxin system AbiEi family antitoxin domain-containing protein [Candidatus Neomarinimicrobiota bacterium]